MTEGRAEGVSPLQSRSGRQMMLAAAHRLLGAAYLWGGLTTRGIDCSGLTHLTARVAGLTLPRDARAQYEAGEPVGRAGLQAGDLVFYATPGEPNPSHVAIYIGQGRIIQAASGRGVHQAPVFSPSPYLTWCGARRIWKTGT